MSEKLMVLGPDYSSFVRCVMLSCREKGVEYELRPADAGLKRLNPFMRVPVLEHEGLILYETAAICRYIDRRFEGPPLSPGGIEQLAWMDQWISAALCYFDPAIIRRYVLEYALPKGENGAVREEVIAEAEQEIKGYLKIMSRALGRYAYFSGASAGIADYLIIPMLDYLANGVVPTRLIEAYPVVKRYCDVMGQRPSCRRVLGRPEGVV